MDKLSIDVQLATSYTSKKYKKLLGDHLTGILDESLASPEYSKMTIRFSNELYWECVEKIHEKFHDTISEYFTEEEDDRLFEEKTILTKRIIANLGSFYDKSNDLIKSIDFTVNNHANNYIFSKLKEHVKINNLWDSCDKVFTDHGLLYLFSEDKDTYRNLLKHQESDLSKEATIGVLRKGAKKDFGISYIRDSYQLRKTFLDILEDEKHNFENPIKKEDIFKLFREKLAIPADDLTNQNISNWIIKPLKNGIRIGSNKEGYFLIKTFDDLLHSYDSHYNNYIGFYNTLNRYEKIAETLFGESNITEFQKHRKNEN
ncbi:hypothetical protein GOQ04_03640 [Emticicia sp. ODNR4P]|nr:hypothetical protein [Emticicia sp. ODNR4P]